MDEIFDGSGEGHAPPSTIISIPRFPSQAPSSETQPSTEEQPCDTEDQQPGLSTATQTTWATGQKKSNGRLFHDN